MKQTFIISALFILLMSACTSHPKDNTNFSFILTPDNDVLFSEVFDDAEYHLLMAQDSVQLGDIERFRVSSHYFGFISTTGTDCSPKQTVYIINRVNFDLKLVISNQGSEPHEYVNLSDIYLGEEDIQLLDKCGKKILVYDYAGNLKKRIEIPINAFSFFDAGENEYWLYSNNDINNTDYQLMRYNSNTSVVDKEYIPIDKHIASYLFLGTGTNFVSNNSHLYFYSPPAQTIYSLTNDTIISTYTFDFGKYNVPEDYYKQHFKDIVDFSNKTNKAGYVYFVTNYGLNNDNLVISFFLNDMPFIAFGNMQTMTTKCGNMLTDDINDLKSFKFDYTNQLFDVYRNVLYMIVSPEQIINSCKNDDCHEFVNYNKLTPDSNPLIMICELKDQYAVK